MAKLQIAARIPLTHQNLQILQRKPAIEYRSGTKVDVKHICRDLDGNPLQLTELADDPVVQVHFYEGVSGLSSGLDPITADVDATDKSIVTFELSGSICPGVYNGEIRLLDTDESVLYLDELFLYVEPSGIENNRSRRIPALKQFRIGLRDSANSESRLLPDGAFGTAEICEAAIRAVEAWNDEPPNSKTYKSTTFPYRQKWIEGTVANLMFMAAEWYQRNELPHQSGGVTYNDMDKWKWYKTEGERRWKAYMEWVSLEKRRINMSNAWGWVH